LTEVDCKDLILGIGDDTAVIRIVERQAMLITSDIQGENQHWLTKSNSSDLLLTHYIL